MSGNVAERIPLGRPWVMISVNNDTDFHFRKAQFDPGDCPIGCSRPCERVCPAGASKFESSIHYNDVPLNASSISKFLVFPKAGVISERCYGCGRCLPVCPYGKIRENTYVRTNVAITKLLTRSNVGAIEIHTSAGYILPILGPPMACGEWEGVVMSTSKIHEVGEDNVECLPVRGYGV
ncbi:hypothetical protein SUGI_0611330 [Cryptomeria japonica]|nr:hypothetical protein SUGI_0611330 [Cryptomeria japonica]